MFFLYILEEFSPGQDVSSDAPGEGLCSKSTAFCRGTCQTIPVHIEVEQRLAEIPVIPRKEVSYAGVRGHVVS